MGAKEDKRRQRKRRVFYRDGWQDQHGEWFAMCAGGCGVVLSWHTGVLDLYPIRKADGGTFRHDNVHLVCRPCRTAAHRRDLAERTQVVSHAN